MGRDIAHGGVSDVLVNSEPGVGGVMLRAIAIRLIRQWILLCAVRLPLFRPLPLIGDVTASVRSA